METLHFSIHINAAPETVWDVMLQEDTYKIWTAAFEPGSHYKGEWTEGAEIRFLSADSQMGMASVIKESRKPEFVSIQHVGIVKDGAVDSTSDFAKQWTPAFENYRFTEADDGTDLSVSIDAMPENKPMFEQTWPAALKLLKELAEK